LVLVPWVWFFHWKHDHISYFYFLHITKSSPGANVVSDQVERFCYLIYLEALCT
jgi:hypothetical protein